MNKKAIFNPQRYLICLLILSIILFSLQSCNKVQEQPKKESSPHTKAMTELSNQHKRKHHSLGQGKPVIYQVFTRLFGNKNDSNIPWGTMEQNGVGKFADFNDEALLGIKALGTSYIWYTGVPHHAVINDYSEYGITNDDPDVVKGRAGSPYAVKDYYNVNPDLAIQANNRLAEFEALIRRTHKHGMKVIIDIVPNHVARHYQSLSLPEGQNNFGATDITSLEYHKHNNFYYIQGEPFQVPDAEDQMVLGGEQHPLADNTFEEVPAKWTGNGSRAAKPNANDWYETVKVNYGVRPDGTYDFPRLPDDFDDKTYKQHNEFWSQQTDLPDSWYKFEAIVHYWLEKGVDGFRYDMAEMVPVEFWSFLNASIKVKYPETLLLAEVYNPDLYRDYIQLGKMDYLYDKVEFYDSLKLVMQGKGPASPLAEIQTSLADIEQHMLHFLENHDEQRIASPEFAGSAEHGKPAMVVSALISRSPTMLYFGQDVGEDGSEDLGFGKPSRTSIFDYAGVPAHQAWMNNGKFDGGQLSLEQKQLREFYKTLMNISARHPAMQGDFISLHSHNLITGEHYSEQQFSFVRYTNNVMLIVVSNFAMQTSKLRLKLPKNLIHRLESIKGGSVANKSYPLNDLLGGDTSHLLFNDNTATFDLELSPMQSQVFELVLTSGD
ncbi:alpha-amylase family protein [Glaciecola petra]|uniref:Alpha-amylase family protein n=1 Tax=Glaciecola petra TaxID=3075602 RepID=A0ABU2ZP97_9ALTE|nr:alpha-amylase family protein [Aestuariibacter sp. P117]MDT0594452.1 alpha-amylase family protein [Aestuariibacter sp. P117]